MSTMILQELPYAKDPVFEPGLWFPALALAGTRAGTYGTPRPLAPARRLSLTARKRRARVA